MHEYTGSSTEPPATSTVRLRKRDMQLAYAAHFSRAIREEYHPLKSASKLIARAAGVSPRTADDWLSGKSAPGSLDNLIPLIASNEKLLSELLRLVEEHRAK